MREQEDRDEAMRALDDAVSGAAHAHFAGNSQVLDYIVLVQREDVEQPGVTSYNYILSGGTMPWHRILGLMAVFNRLMAEELSRSDPENPS
jgi:hypothetical protein